MTRINYLLDIFGRYNPEVELDAEGRVVTLVIRIPLDSTEQVEVEIEEDEEKKAG